MAQRVLSEGRLLDASRMIEPLIEPGDSDTNGRADGSRLMLRCLMARIHLLRNGDVEKVFDLIGDYERSDARTALEPTLRAEVALWLGWSRAWQEDEHYDDARALHLLDEAHRCFDQEMNPAGRCWTRIAQAHAYFSIDEYHLMLQAIDEAETLQETLNDAYAKAWLDDLSVIGARYEGRFRAAKKHAEALQHFATEYRDDYALGRALTHRAALDLELGRDVNGIIGTATKALALLQRSAVNPGRSLLRVHQTHIAALIRKGLWKKADRAIDEALKQIGALGTAPAYVTLHRARLAAYRGDLDDAIEILVDISARVQRHHRILNARIHHTYADVFLAQGRLDEAIGHAEEGYAIAREAGHAGSELRSLLQKARIEIGRGREDEARRAMRDAEVHADYFSVLPLAAERFFMHADLAALSDRVDEARAYFTHALSAFSLSGDVYSEAHVQVELARLSGTSAEARTLTAAAVATFERLGAVPDLKRAHNLLSAAPRTDAPAMSAHEADIGSIMARAAISVDLVAEAWLQAAEELAPGRWLVVYRCDDDSEWSIVHKHGAVPSDLEFPEPTQERICEKGVDWVRLRGLPAPVFFFGMECGGDDDPACAAIEKRLQPWIPVVGLALEHALLRSSRLTGVTTNGEAHDLNLNGFVYSSSSMRSVVNQIRRVRSSHSPVLITGERGAGKGRVARAIHEVSDRCASPFVAFDCSSVPADVLERSLFGSPPEGSLLAARNGTLYLDEVCDLHLEAQPRLLRFLETGSILTPDADEPRRADVRIVASSTRDLQALVSAGKFREDLYFRLSVVPIRIPPLRERREEIPLLVQYFLREFSTSNAGRASITNRALDALLRYDWPGNVRQLRNEIERLILVAAGEPFSTIDLEDLSPPILETAKNDGVHLNGKQGDQPLLLDDKGLDDILAGTEKSVIERVLARHAGQVSSTAEELGLSRQGLYKKMKRLGIDSSAFQPDAASQGNAG